MAREHLTGLLDEQFDKYQFAGATSPLWRVVYALGPATRAEWFCLLGDRAAARGDEAAAADRYQAVDRFGAEGIREWLERLHDLSAYRLLPIRSNFAPGQYPYSPSATARVGVYPQPYRALAAWSSR